MHKDRESPYISTLMAMSYFIGMREKGKGEQKKRERERETKEETSNSIKN